MFLDHVIEVLDIGLNAIIKDLGFFLDTLFIVFVANDFLGPLILLGDDLSLLLCLGLLGRCSLSWLVIRLVRVGIRRVKALL